MLCALLLLNRGATAKNLKGAKLYFVCEDTVFKNPFIDIDKTINTPVKCRYIHGGFDDGTRFSFYFPEKKAYTGRFFQYITPFPDSETSAQAYPDDISPIGFSITHGAYFVETNEGGKLDFADPSTSRDASIGAYRANAACAELSRYIAKLIYNCERPYGYCYGGSGGAFRSAGGMEITKGVWDGAVPFVMGSPNAIPNVFGVRMHALRMLKDKMDDIIDALRPGGSGDPYATLTAEQRQALQECTRMGFPIQAWYGWPYMDAHGFIVLYKSLVMMDQQYFREDFWNKPGYLGYDNPASLQRDHVQTKGVVKRIIGQAEAERLGLTKPLSEADRGTADRAWASMGTEIKNKPVAYEIDVDVKDIGMGGDLIILSSPGKDQRIQITKTDGQYIALADVNEPKLLTLLRVGDSVQVDNSDFLAVQTYYRHQVPSLDYYAWNQFRGYNGVPIYPQRPYLIGPYITMGAAGCVPDGKINGKMILCCSVWDREAFAWQGDWYRNKVKQHLGNATDDNFRLWFTDRSTHGDVDDPTEVVSYMGILYQSLLDVSAWAEKGIAPSKTSDYEIVDAQVMLGADGQSRGGVQPVPSASINGKAHADVEPGQKVTIRVMVDVPAGTGKIVAAEWCLDNSKQYTRPVDLSKAVYSADGGRVEFDTEVSYDIPGTYFPTVRVYSERNGNPDAMYTRIANLAKVRVVVSNPLPYHSVKPGQVWLDTNGKPIQAHGFQVIEKDGTYYWYGENKEFTTPGSHVWTYGIRCYKSTDFYNWEDCGLIIEPDTVSPLSPLHYSQNLDRPHIIHCKKTGKYVCWIKSMDEDGYFVILQANDLMGPYTYVRSLKPQGYGVGDFDLYADPDTGKGYVWFERPHWEMICSELTDDYTNVTTKFSTHFVGIRPPYTREAPTHFVHNGKHYMFTSGTTGYYPNESLISTFTDYHGEYTDLGNPHPTDTYNHSFCSQITDVVKIPGKDLYVAVADRWMPQLANTFEPAAEAERMIPKYKDHKPFPKDFSTPKPKDKRNEVRTTWDVTYNARYVFLPIVFKDGVPQIEWKDEWRIEDYK